MLADVGVDALVDADSPLRRTFGYAKQGASFGYPKVKGLHPLLAVLATPTAAPLVVASRLPEGRAASARGAACFVAEALAAARQAGATGLVGFRAGARCSVTVRMTASVQAALAALDETAWQPITYPQAVWDDDEGRWVSDAEIAEVDYPAFTGRRTAGQHAARLVVRG